MSTQVPLAGEGIHSAGTESVQEGLTPEEVASIVEETIAGDGAEASDGTTSKPDAQPTGGTTSPAATPEDPVFDVPGLGQIKASQVRGLMAQKATFESIRQEKERLESRAEEVEQLRLEAQETRYLRSLMNHKPFRDKMQQALVEAASSPGTMGAADGKASDFFQSLKNPEVEELKSKLDQVTNYVFLAQEKEAAQDIQGILDDYSTRYPDIVTKEVQQGLIDAAAEHFADQADTFRPAHFKSFVNEMLSDQILEHERQKARNEALDSLKQQPQARVVTGKGTRPAAKPPEENWAKKEWRDISESVAKDLMATE